MEHLALSLAAELSLGPRYQCKKCNAKLRTEKSDRTNWQEWFYDIETGKKHCKTYCNFKKEA